MNLRTVSETALFQKWVKDVWTENELDTFKVWIAHNPQAGDVVPNGGGVRKVRWSASGRGKRGGARVIYFNQEQERIWLLLAYTKAKFDNLPSSFLEQLRKEIEND
jgi:hypothetical protein